MRCRRYRFFIVSSATVGPLRLFYSYAHADEELRLDLEKHLGLLRRQNIIFDWSDRQIRAGAGWESEISRNLEAADIVLLLIAQISSIPPTAMSSKCRVRLRNIVPAKR